jgi:hypothetical protein
MLLPIYLGLCSTKMSTIMDHGVRMDIIKDNVALAVLVNEPVQSLRGPERILKGRRSAISAELLGDRILARSDQASD